jgi:hypothetical protein
VSRCVVVGEQYALSSKVGQVALAECFLVILMLDILSRYRIFKPDLIKVVEHCALHI